MYSIRFITKEQLNYIHFMKIVQSPTIAKLIFPLVLNVASEEVPEENLANYEVVFKNANEFDLDFYLKHFKPKGEERLIFNFGGSIARLTITNGVKGRLRSNPIFSDTHILLYLDEKSIINQSLVTIDDLIDISNELASIVPFYRSTAGITIQILRELNRPKTIGLENGLTLTPAIGWFSFWQNDLVDYIGREKFENLKTYYQRMIENDGIWLILQKEPFIYSNSEHITREEQALEELGILNLFQLPDS